MALGINDLVSIEGTDDPEERVRFTNNNPYAGLTLKFGLASAVLPTIDFSRRTLVWLDYDGALARSMANDIATVARSAASGTFIGVTFTTAFPVTPKDREKELTRLKDDFSDFLPEGTPAQEALFIGRVEECIKLSVRRATSTRATLWIFRF